MGWNEDSRTTWSNEVCIWQHQDRRRLRRSTCRAHRCSLRVSWFASVCLLMLILYRDWCPHCSSWCWCCRYSSRSHFFVVIFCNWRCSLYTSRRWQWTVLTDTELITVNFAPNSLWDSCHKEIDDSLIVASFPVRSVSSPSSWWCLRGGMPPGSLPLPPPRRKNFATNFHSTLYPPLSWGDARLTALSWSQVDALSASCRNPQNSNVSTNCHGIHQVSSSVAIWVWSSFASLSISRITSSERPNSIIVPFWTTYHG